jgi:hypothetical protein
MGIAVEIVRTEKVGDLNDCLWINDDTSEDTALGLNILRQ